MNTFKFFKLIKNDKRPISKLDKRQHYEKDKINPGLFNIGLECAINNLIVFDVDKKNDGVKEFNKFCKNNGSFGTLTQTTPSGGFHFIFKKTERENEKRLKNKSGYRGKGLDIRTGTGYVVVEPSEINGKKYKILNPDTEPQEMPDALIDWLLEYEKEPRENEEKKYNLTYFIEAPKLDKIEEILRENEPTGKNWHIMTSCIKNLLETPYNSLNEEDKAILVNMWDKWSKQSKEKYNKKNNFSILENIKDPKFNFNYFSKNKYFKQAPKIPQSIEPDIRLNERFLNLDILKNNKNKDVILKSTTGTGKTTLLNAYVSHLQEVEGVENVRFLSLVHLVSMADQQKESLKNIKNLKHYKEAHDIEEDNLIICVNSILKFYHFEPEFFAPYVVYIDEITSILNALTHSPLLEKTLKPVYETLNKIIINCRQIIATDAQILDNSFILLKDRNKKRLFIENTYKKWNNIQALHIKDENKFLEIMKEEAKNKKLFYFGSDSKTKTEFFFNEINKIDTTYNNFLYTATDKELTNKFFNTSRLFYSPSITTGVDINPASVCDVFIYVKGNTISPLDSFQQLTRCRNIKNIYFYIDDKKNYFSKYDSLDDTKQKIENEIIKHSGLLNLFDNKLFNELFIYNEFLNEIMKTNKEIIFKGILSNNNINIKTKGQIKKIKNKIINAAIIEEDDRKNKKIEKIKTEEQTPEYIEKIISILNIKKEDIDKEPFIQLIKNNFLFGSFLNFYRLLLPFDVIESKFKTISENNPNYKVAYANFYKIKLIKELEDELKIQRFSLDGLTSWNNEEIKINDNLIKRINSTFRSTQEPKNKNDVISYYIAKINNLIGDLSIIKTTKQERKQDGRRLKKTNYKLDETIIKKYLFIINNMNKSPFSYYLENDKIETVDKLKFIKTPGEKKTTKPTKEEPLKEETEEENEETGKEPLEEKSPYIFPDLDGLDFGLYY
jgi:hypothetical protein